jgi:hypothetical protein
MELKTSPLSPQGTWLTTVLNEGDIVHIETDWTDDVAVIDDRWELFSFIKILIFISRIQAYSFPN